MTTFNLTINNETQKVDADPATPLIFILRGRFGLTGAKLGCALEQCGACAVLVDDKVTLSCVRAASELEGRSITTIEALADDSIGRDVQRAFVEAGAAQCGYCTAGIVVAVTGLLKQKRNPTDAEIRTALAPHLCRCGSHAGVMRAVKRLVGPEAADG
jgi:aerobic-type carbon monoxide dehydrogenase small subunit (CoxS/CutS family)